MTTASTSAESEPDTVVGLVALPGGELERRQRRAFARSEARRLARAAALRLGATRGDVVTQVSGAPQLPDAPELQVSLSHSSDWSAAAVTRHAAIGIDVERIVIGRDRGALASVVLDTGDALPPGLSEAAASRALHLHWSLREAIGKATGGGLWAGRAALRLRCDRSHGLPVAWSAVAPGSESWWLAWDWLEDDGVLALAIKADAEPWSRCELPTGLSLERLERA